MVKIYYSNINLLKDNKLYKKAYLKISEQRRVKADRYIRQESKFQCIVTGVLESLFCEDIFYINKIPMLKNGYVSISHSGGYVVLAIADNEIGIDIQKNDKTLRGVSNLRWCKTESYFKRVKSGSIKTLLNEELSGHFESINIDDDYICVLSSENKESVELIDVDIEEKLN